MEHAHTPEAINERLELGPNHSYLRDWVYGGIDGAVTTFAVVSGVIGASLSPAVIIILGFANLVGDGFSMAASNYSGTKTEREEKEHLRQVEYRHIDIDPEGEREEIRQIFMRKGFDGEELERLVAKITSDRELWVRTMLMEEYGLPLEIRSPLLAALSTFSSFCLCGLVPLLPYLLGIKSTFLVSTLMTALVFFAIGSAKSIWSVIPWWRSGLETLAIGSTAAGLAYLIGYFLRGLV
jgi:VIT1/CCC1 family predicted Fe2+/Mn2+ transporter